MLVDDQQVVVFVENVVRGKHSVRSWGPHRGCRPAAAGPVQSLKVKGSSSDAEATAEAEPPPLITTRMGTP